MLKLRRLAFHEFLWLGFMLIFVSVGVPGPLALPGFFLGIFIAALAFQEIFE